MVAIDVGFLFFGARLVRLFKGLHCLLFNVGPLRRRLVFNDKLPDRAVPFPFDVSMSFARIIFSAIHVFSCSLGISQ